MSRPRKKTNKDLPQGLYYKESRGIYLFTRIDGSTKSFKDRRTAKLAAHTYNRTYRVDPELVHGIYVDGKEKDRIEKKSNPLGLCLREMFSRVQTESKWKSSTLAIRKQRFEHIFEHFKDIIASDLRLDDVTEFMNKYDGINNGDLYNRYLHLLKTILDACVDQGYLENNPALKKNRKIVKGIASTERNRLTINDFKLIHEQALKEGLIWMQVAMELGLQTAQGVNEVASLKYSDIEDGHIKIIRKKNITNDASRVKIPLNPEFESILELSESDNVESPYIVHRQRERRYINRELGKGVCHETQVTSDKISRTFSLLRDSVGIQKEIRKNSRSGFHDIRALSIHLLDNMGIDSKVRAAQANDRTNEIYRKGHLHWNVAEEATIKWNDIN
jgi:hypothetical protein